MTPPETAINLKSCILVVDDAPDNLMLMSDLLRARYKVKLANSGQKAIKIATESPPDLILLDIMMPEVCKRPAKYIYRRGRAAGIIAPDQSNPMGASMTETRKPAGRPQRRTPQQWAELVEDYEASGQSQRAFCAARGVGQSSLRYWKRRLEKRSGEAPLAVTRGARLVPVSLIEEHAPLAASSGVSILTGGGVRIEVKRHFDAVVLRGVVAALGAQG